MSAVVARRLQEIAQRGEERRRRVSEIRRRSSIVTDAVHELCLQTERRATWGTRESWTPVVPREMRSGNDALDAIEGSTAGDVLSQVRQVLMEIDSQAREQWNDEDGLIYICLQQALAAAVRKGYAFGDIRAILEELKPPDMSA